MLSKYCIIIANMLSKCCNIIDAMCSLNVAQYIANILSNYCQYIAQYLASLTIDSICSIFIVILSLEFSWDPIYTVGFWTQIRSNVKFRTIVP